MAGAGVGGEGGGRAWRCRRLRPRLPAPAAGLSGPGSSDVPRQECPSSDNVIYISGRVRGSAAPGARRPLCQEPRAALLPLRRRRHRRPRVQGGRRFSPSAGESWEGPTARGVWVPVRERRGAAGAQGSGWGTPPRAPRVRREGCGARGRPWRGCGNDHPGTREPARVGEALGEAGR